MDPGSDDPPETGEPGGPGTGGGDHTGNDNAVGCPSVLADVSAVIPTVMLLVDQSGTMNQEFGALSRWDAIYQTLMEPASGVVDSYDDQVQLGLTLFSGEDDNPTCPLLTQVSPQMGNFSAINAVFGPADPIEDTPTGEALSATAAAMASLGGTGPKAIVVATDGEPDTCAAPDPDGQPAAQAMAVAAARAAHEQGIETYIISVGDDVSDAHLQEMANAGIGLPEQGPEDAPFWRALNPIALEDAFDGIVAGVQGCDFELDGAVPDAATGTVTLDGVPLNMGSDWEIAGNNTIRLLGSACDTIRDGGTHEVEAIFACSGDQNGPGDGSGGHGGGGDGSGGGGGDGTGGGSGGGSGSGGPCVVDDDCEGDDVCNNAGTCESPGSGGPIVR